MKPGIFYNLTNGYNKKGTIRVRRLEWWEAKSLTSGQRVLFRTIQNEVREVKVNGKPKTWKRKYPLKVEVPVKYGLWEYGTFSWDYSLNQEPPQCWFVTTKPVEGS